MSEFRIRSDFGPAGDQPAAIERLVEGVGAGRRHQVLLGVTGSGKTFTVANVIERLQRPTLVLAHNKTLAAQLFREFRELFPENAVEYFVSYYDYYQPEAYVPVTDTYIAKETSINDEIDRLRHSATRAILERRDTIVVASVSCIFAMGSPDEYRRMVREVRIGQELAPEALAAALAAMQYDREQYDFRRGTFRWRGDTIEVFPAWEASRALRVSWFGDQVESIEEVDPLTGTRLSGLDRALILCNTHYVTSREVVERAMGDIRKELKSRVAQLTDMGKPHYAERLEQRVSYDLELLEVSGHCPGIENYSRFMDGRNPGDVPWTLLDYFPRDFLCVVDESHVTLPQIQGMYKGDRSRKQTLVDYGFRLPSALDNRPLTFEEWLERVGQAIHISATPGEFEVAAAGGSVVEQIVRPTGLLDPIMDVRPARTQVEDLLPEIRERTARRQRVLVATLTKRMAEDLTEFLREQGILAAYLHADIDTLERMELLHALREGRYDVLVGINLLREGLDLPEVSLVAVLDADKEGFLRGERSLIQVSGRAARNLDGKVILYADTVTTSMAAALAEADRRRRIQEAYNRTHGIVPRSVVKPLLPMPRTGLAERAKRTDGDALDWNVDVILKEIEALRRQMKEAAKRLEFERAGELRDAIQTLQELIVKA
ncbi:MAG: excinuclease ABC subunit UvrB [Deltaproteobacteria bacterium]|nr:excinuclease ABC subunit UvrB [Deltaproteobacteria bacterium]